MKFTPKTRLCIYSDKDGFGVDAEGGYVEMTYVIARALHKNPEIKQMFKVAMDSIKKFEKEYDLINSDLKGIDIKPNLEKDLSDLFVKGGKKND